MQNPLIDASTRELAPEFLTRILAPYQGTGTAYLRSANVVNASLAETPEPDAPLFAVSGRFSIGSSCYIQDTGHFNAVEFLICYNQLAYSTFGYMFQAGVFKDGAATRLARPCREVLATISVDRFYAQQLSSMLILKSAMRFRDIIDSHDFSGTLYVDRISYHKGGFFTETRCVFEDRGKGKAEGEILLGYIADGAPKVASHPSEHAESKALAY